MAEIPEAVLEAFDGVLNSGVRFNLQTLDDAGKKAGGDWRQAHTILEHWRKTGVVIPDNRAGHTKTTHWRKK
jgi:hypothetical protein